MAGGERERARPSPPRDALGGPVGVGIRRGHVAAASSSRRTDGTSWPTRRLRSKTAFSCDGIFDKDGKPLEFVPGQRILKGYLYSLRNKKERKYERHDEAFAASAPPSRFAQPPHTGWPVVYFPPAFLLHVKFHMIPVTSNTARREEWYVLDAAEHDAIQAAAENQKE